MRPIRLVAFPALATVMVLCGCGKSAADEIASARAHLDQRDYRTATIELKSALQKEPQSAQARMLLGQALYGSGDFQASAIELGKALGGAPADDVVPLLARAQLALGAHQKVTGDLAARQLSRPQAIADLQTSVGTAWMDQAQPDRAREALRIALAAQPDFAQARLLQARMSAGERRVDEALGIVDEVLAADPKRADAALLKGNLLLVGKSDAAAAIAAYRAGLVQQPDSLDLHVTLINAFLTLGERQQAREQFAALQKVHPRHPQTLVLEAMFAMQAGDTRKSREIMQGLLKQAPDQPLLLLTAGWMELQQGSPTQAETHLSKAIQLAPDLADARRLLGELYLRNGQPAKALEVLRPALSTGLPDAQLLYTAAVAATQAGDPRSADELFARAGKAAPRNARLETARAMARLWRGDAQGIGMLDTVAASDSNSIEPDAALVAAFMRGGDITKALAAIDRMARKAPRSPLPEDLRGRVLLTQGDPVAARRSFERALELQADYGPALSQLAAMDAAGGRFDAARERLEAVRKANPRDPGPVLALAALAERARRPRAEVMALYGEAQKLAPQDAYVRRAQVQYLLDQNELKDALETAQASAAALPDNPMVLEMLGIAQAANGQQQQAVASFAKLATLAPKDATPQLRLAALQIKQGDVDAAARSLSRAAELAPTSPLLAAGVLTLGDLPQGGARALDIAKSLQRSHPAAGAAIEGDLRARRKEWPAARAAFQAALDAAGAEYGNLPASLHRALIAEGKSAEADRFAAEWLRQHPKDTVLRLHLGDLAMDQRGFDKAVASYRQVLSQAPANVHALNNLAWVLAEQGQPEAVEVARRALALAPRSPKLLDTLAHALAQTGQTQEALQVLQQAVAAAPAVPSLRVKLARLQLKAGDKSAARASLEQVIKADASAEVTNDARRLLASL